MKRYTAVPFTDVRVNGGFWKQKQDLVNDVTIGAVYDRFAETRRFAALRCQKDPAHPNEPHIFWDSDVAKWIESAAYLIERGPRPDLEAKVDAMVDDIAASQWPDGYFQSHFITLEPEARWTRRGDHELYCAGHLMEAAVAYDHATGKDTLLGVVRRMADHIERVFVRDKSAGFLTPGHEEIELALVRLYEHTGEARYLALAQHFLDRRGSKEDAPAYGWANGMYMQAHQPVREQTTAEGHSVRAVYLYNGMARVAAHTGDETMLNAAKTLFDSIADRRMYITGGIGSSHIGEAFTVDYHLPNQQAYAESCAALGLALFANQLLKCDLNSRYADVAERAMYNGFLSSVSLDGRRFFYENPLEIDPSLRTKDASIEPKDRERFPITQRVEVFDCSCCPPNITRFIASVADSLYTHDGTTLYVHQYMESSAEFPLGDGTACVTQKTRYPYDGRIGLTVSGPSSVALRIPGWCRRWTLTVDGQRVEPTCCRGYACVDLPAGGAALELELAMPVELVAAHPRVQEDAGRVAVTRGPLVYCLEGVDNGPLLRDVRVRPTADYTVGFDAALGVGAIETVGLRRRAAEDAPLYAPLQDDAEAVPLKFIPYFAFANRGETEMLVWVLPA